MSKNEISENDAPTLNASSSGISSSSSSSSSSSESSSSSRRSTRERTTSTRLNDQFSFESEVDDENDEENIVHFSSRNDVDYEDDDYEDSPIAHVVESQASSDTSSASSKKKSKPKSVSSSSSSASRRNSSPAVEFDWSTSSSNIVSPIGRFRRATGNELDDDITPFDVFSLFVSEELISQWVSYTNQCMRAANKSYPKTTVNEMYGFIGIHICMGMYQFPSIKDYWNVSLGLPLVQKHFSRTRFEVLNSHFRISHSSSWDPDSRNPSSYCSSFITHLNNTFPKHFHPTQHLAFDESIAAYKGHSTIKQYLPMKPHKFGYKVWVLASDSYLLRFQLYEGADADNTQHNKTHNLILDFMKDYHNRSHILYIDNFFTSPTLVKELATYKIAVVGSVRLNRKGMPDQQLLNDDVIKTIKRGETMFFREPNMNLLLWRDQSLLKIVFNHRNINETITTVPRYFENRGYINMSVHPAVVDYFKHARSVDIINQYHYAYVIGRKTRHFSTSLMWWCISVCIVNAYHLYSQRNNHCKHKQFRQLLMMQLLARHTPPTHTSTLPTTSTINNNDASVHYIDVSTKKRRCHSCPLDAKKRRRTVYVCVGCKVPLHIGSCFSQYHSKQQ